MLGRGLRAFIAASMSVGLFVVVAAPQVSGATCTLTAPATVAVGTPMTISGSGFPASTSVDISLTLEGGTADEFAVQSDTGGAFQINLTPEPQDAGKTTVVATAGTTCSAQAIFTVTTPTPTATPKPTATQKPTATPKPTTAPKPTATAAPDGSAAGVTSGNATPPRTDEAPRPAERPSGVPLASWVLAGLVLVIGVGSLIATRRARGG